MKYDLQEATTYLCGKCVELQTVIGKMMSRLTQHYRKQTAQDTVKYLFVVTLTTRV